MRAGLALAVAGVTLSVCSTAFADDTNGILASFGLLGSWSIDCGMNPKDPLPQ